LQVPKSKNVVTGSPKASLRATATLRRQNSVGLADVVQSVSVRGVVVFQREGKAGFLNEAGRSTP
jgi:hypothetical protein